jgi:hypothetical protein
MEFSPLLRRRFCPWRLLHGYVSTGFGPDCAVLFDGFPRILETDDAEIVSHTSFIYYLFRVEATATDDGSLRLPLAR